ncbi:hypothetical protein SPONL_1417 [uncultured Candidatus Thioglobus sp.]|nr:hypothetical protein SPONL_1417 [uncultured Candidatus Thioglobus sp.]
MPPKVRARSVKTLRKMIKMREDKQLQKQSKCSCFNKRDEKLMPSQVPATTLTPELEKASNEGWNFIKAVAFPSLPALLQDLWVYLELFITTLAFSLGIAGQFPITCDLAFQYTYFVLTAVSMILALIDAYMYFIEVGSCARAIRYYKNTFSRKSKKEDDNDYDEFQKKTCCSTEVKEKLHMFFELGRNVVTELLLYPILIFDLFSFETEETYHPGDLVDRIDYSLFVIGSFYLILAVYIMRFLVLIGSIQSLLRLPVNNKNSSSSILLKFSFHACGQILVHLMIVLAIGAKINTENSMTTDDTNVSNSSNCDTIIRASPFLWVSIALGWLLPLAGTTAFFIANYYWITEFTIDFWLNMISLLQGASFAESVFGGEGVSETKEKTLDFVQGTDYAKVKQQLVRYKSPHWSTKFFYPTKLPVAAICGLLYDICLVVFIGSLILTYNDGTIEFVVLNGDNIYTPIFFVAVSIILLANIHILFLLNSVLIMLILILAIAVFLVFLITPLLVFVYFPVVGLLGYSLLLKQLFSSNKDTAAVNENLSLEEKVAADNELKEYV